MSDYLENTICKFHQMQTIAIDLNPFIEIEKKQLCAKCLAIRASSNHQVVLNEEFKAIVEEIRLNEFKKQRRIFEESQSNYNQFCFKLQNNQEHFNTSSNKILTLINHLDKDQKKCFEQYSKPDDSICQQDLLIFNKKSKIVSSTQSPIQKETEKDEEFQKVLLEQFQNLSPENLYQEIMKMIDQIYELNQSRKIEIDIYSQYQDSKKTPSLQHVCSKHGKEIVMFTLVQDYNEDRSLCIDCIPNVTIKLTTLEEANNMWLIHQEKIYESKNEFIKKREQIQQKLQVIFSQYKEKGRIMQDEIMKLIKMQNQDIETNIADLEQNKNKKQLVQLEQQEIQIIISLLSQSDRMSQAKEFQMKLKLDDQEYQNQILQKLNEIEQVQNDCRQELFKMFDVYDLLFSDTQIQLEKFQKEIKTSQLDSGIFTILIPKFQNEFYQSLLVLMQDISEKGHQYIEQLNSTNSVIKKQELEKMNIEKYQNILHQFDRQFKIIKNETNLRDASTQIQNIFEVDSKILNFPKQLAKQKQLSINSINTMKLKCKLQKFGLQDKLIQTNKNLNINSQIITVKNQFKKKAFSVSFQLQTNWSKPYNSKYLKFSQILKHSNLIISIDGKTAKSTSYNWLLCLCDQQIPKYGTYAVDFKVKQLSHLMAGVCLIDYIKKDYQDSDGISKGCYFLRANGYIYSQHDLEKNNKKLGFQIELHDTISMIVNAQQKQITWRNKAKNQIYTLDIQTTFELYFCFQLSGYTEIELFENVL